MASGKVIDVFTYYTTPQKEVWKSSLLYAKDAIQHYSSLVGEYPYNVVSVVQWLGWLWPFAALVYLLSLLWSRDTKN